MTILRQKSGRAKQIPGKELYRKNFLLAAAEDEATVPPGVDEPEVEPKSVSIRKLRIEDLNLECEWQSCRWKFSDYELFQSHVNGHISDIHVIKTDDKADAEYVCLWDVCGHKTTNYCEMIRHINYHSYHAKLLAIGYNGRATLDLARCKKDSTKRNQLPKFISEHTCLWVGCTCKFDSMQTFVDHVRLHVGGEPALCSWAGCGATFPRRSLLAAHVRSHTGERLIACYHCGAHFASNRKLRDHLRRQNVNPQSSYNCSFCGLACATEYLEKEHSRQHVSLYACSLCDMSAPSLAALAQHVRYRHLGKEAARTHACPHCPYRAVTKCDLRKHIPTHTRKRRRKVKDEGGSDREGDGSDSGPSDEESCDPRKKPRTPRKYACHVCPDKEAKVFSRGTRLTTHLVKVHGAQWPFGHSRFRYQLSEDGMYRLTTTRIEEIEVSKKIVGGYSGPKRSLGNTFDFELKQVAEATETSPTHFSVKLKGESRDVDDEKVEITMCDVDEDGNIISAKVIESDFVYA
ncbi:unnamed protein product, partial [Iphiclides podalirius]